MTTVLQTAEGGLIEKVQNEEAAAIAAAGLEQGVHRKPVFRGADHRLENAGA